MGGIFYCDLCKFRDPTKGTARRARGRLTLTKDSLVSAKHLLLPHCAAGSGTPDNLIVGSFLCLECFPEELRSQVTRVRYGKRSAGTMLVGRCVVRVETAEHAPRLGCVVATTALGEGLGYVVQWATLGDEENAPPREVFTEEQTRSASMLHAIDSNPLLSHSRAHT